MAHPRRLLEQGQEPWQEMSWRPRMVAQWLRSARETLSRADPGCGRGQLPEARAGAGRCVSEGLKGHDPLEPRGERARHIPTAVPPRPQGLAGSVQGCHGQGSAPPPLTLGNRELPTLSQARTPGASLVESTFPHHLCMTVTVRHHSERSDGLPPGPDHGTAWSQPRQPPRGLPATQSLTRVPH